ncbi:MAG TPA: hypothetical protein VJM31_15395 [Vicinamibacterales bacterium]|nr:hypothetical protein [Vicinamibacterales bacterium]
MRRFIVALVTVAIVSSSVALGAQLREPMQRSDEFWFAYASKVPIGSTIRVKTIDGRRETAVLTVVDAEGITLEPKARVPTPPYRVRFEHLEQLELKQNGSSVWKAIAVGAGIGATAFLGLLLLGISD